MKQYILLAILWSVSVNLTAQQLPERRIYDESNNKGKAILLHVNLGAHLPVADMAKRYGADMSVGGGLEQLTANNFIVGAEGYYLFGTKVKEDPLADIRTPDGDLIGLDQSLASVELKERGFYVGATIGKLIIFDPKKRAGLRLTLSGGWLQHRIRLQDNGQTLPQVYGDYQKGYDRLTGGPALAQFIGWQHLGIDRRMNWYIGLDVNQGFTTTLRDWDFNARRKLDERRLDLRVGIRMGWTLPFYPKSPEQIYY